jgi:hypothetical protein
VDAGDAAIARAASSRKVEDRALATFARVALGEASVASALEDREPSIRRAAVMGALARPSREATTAMVARAVEESDPIVQQVLAITLASAEAAASMPSNRLLDVAEGGGADAPLATLAFVRREGDGAAAKIGQLLAAKDPTLRAHAALGLAGSPLPDATGRLAGLYAVESDDVVRRATIAALSARTRDRDAPVRRTTLGQAARLDPDADVRRVARAALAGTATVAATPVRAEVAWLRLVRDDGSAPGTPFAAAVVRGDGIAIPIAFDEAGYAVVAGLPPGDVRLVLTPRLPRP